MYDRKIQCITKLKKCNTNKYIVFKCDTPLFSVSPTPITLSLTSQGEHPPDPLSFPSANALGFFLLSILGKRYNKDILQNIKRRDVKMTIEAKKNMQST